jgi:hypothetical protein
MKFALVTFLDPTWHLRASSKELAMLTPKLCEGYGAIARDDKEVLILCSFKDVTSDEENDYFIIPKGCIIKIETIENDRWN